MSFDVDRIVIMPRGGVDAPNDNTPLLLHTVGPSYIRPIVLHYEHDFTGNLNQISLFIPPRSAGIEIVIDSKMDKDQFHTTFTGHLRGFWWKPGWELWAFRDGVTVQGAIEFGMMYEEWSGYGEPREDMGVMKTQPRWKVPAFFRR